MTTPKLRPPHRPVCQRNAIFQINTDTIQLLKPIFFSLRDGLVIDVLLYSKLEMLCGFRAIINYLSQNQVSGTVSLD